MLEDEVTIWGQVGTTSGNDRSKGSYSWSNGVTKSVEGGKYLASIEESREKLKQLANIKKIPEILNKLK
jgi:UDP-3-O-[3-hydroxymyristoyl] glucosamine N-acyltransferase